MAKERAEAREKRLKQFVATMKQKRCRELITPLEEKIKSYNEGKLPAEEVFKAAYHVGREGKDIEGDFKKRPEVILAGIAMAENKYITGIGDIGVKVRSGDLTSLFTDAVVNPANADGTMSAGVAGAIKKIGGETIEKEAVSKSPIEVGSAVATGAGRLPNRYVIHAPTVIEAGGESSPENVRSAFAAALRVADELGCETVAAPGMGTGVGRVQPSDAAQAMIAAVKSHEKKSVTDIILIDRSDEMVEAFIGALEKYDEESE